MEIFTIPKQRKSPLIGRGCVNSGGLNNATSVRISLLTRSREREFIGYYTVVNED